MDDILSRAQIVTPGFHSTMLNSEVVDMQPPNLSTVNFEHEVYQGSDMRVSILAFFDRFGRNCFCGNNSWKGSLVC
jgi:hypothetical protein